MKKTVAQKRDQFKLIVLKKIYRSADYTSMSLHERINYRAQQNGTFSKLMLNLMSLLVS